MLKVSKFENKSILICWFDLKGFPKVFKKLVKLFKLKNGLQAPNFASKWPRGTKFCLKITPRPLNTVMMILGHSTD